MSARWQWTLALGHSAANVAAMNTEILPQLEPRLDLGDEAPDAYRAMVRLDVAAGAIGLESGLLDLVKMRASQINGCAYCIDMHSKDARAAGETEQRLYALSAWRETPFFSDRERAALELTEAMTRLSERGVPDELWERTRTRFSAQEIAALVFAATVINAWNRLAISTRMVPGSYEVGA